MDLNPTIADLELLAPWFLPMTAFLFGSIVGSFLNVVIYRIPAGKSIVSPGSQCACGQPIKWHHNIPILSWILLRGKASCCGQPYSVRYPAVEALTALLFLFTWLTLSPLAALGGMAFVSLLVAATFIDLDHMIIPDSISIGGTVFAVVISFLVPAIHGYAQADFFILGSIKSGIASIIGVFTGSGLILWIALVAEAVLRKEAMGFGDVKLMGLIGGFLGWQGALFTVFGGAIVGTLWFIFALLLRVLFRKGAPKLLPAESPEGEVVDAGFGAHVPFGPMLAIAAALYLLIAKPYFEAYLQTILAIW
jgi:leader peptidase (prepilin peptidase) / N-methyltransferase